MSYKRLGFAINKTFKLITCTCVASPMLMALTYLSFTSNIDFTLRVLILLTAIATVSHIFYWLRFYYKMYDIHLVAIQGPWFTANSSVAPRYYKSVEIGQRERFYERERAVLRGPYFKDPGDVKNPNAILYGDILVVATCQNDTFADIEEVIREDQRRNGLRWLNNFPVGKGIRGFVNDQGNFHTFADYRQELVLQNRL